jgi:hypothetical protein
MNFHGTRWLAALALLFTTIGLQTVANAQSDYRIELTIARDGSLIARPVIEAEAGAQAEVRNEDPANPESGFKVLITASPLDFSPNGKESIKLDLDFAARHDGKWVTRGQHSVTATLGRPLSFGFPPAKEEPNGKKYELTIRPLSAPGEAQ